MIERAFRTIAFAAVLLAPLAAHAGPMTRVPALFQNGQVYLKVSVNNAAPVWMTFDLAVPGSTLYAARATRATVRAGAVTEAVTFRTATTAAPCAPDGSVVAGRLGSDWLGDRVAEIRPREREVWLSAPIEPPPAPVERTVVDASLAR